ASTCVLPGRGALAGTGRTSPGQYRRMLPCASPISGHSNGDRPVCGVGPDRDPEGLGDRVDAGLGIVVPDRSALSRRDAAEAAPTCLDAAASYSFPDWTPAGFVAGRRDTCFAQ